MKTSIRKIDPESKTEIELVAKRMRQTLVDVLGEEKGGSLYTMEWLVNRVLWHLDPTKTIARVLLSTDRNGKITGQAIARIETDDSGEKFGYFSTIYVEPGSRGQGVGTTLVKAVESWFLEKRMNFIIYNTAANNSRLIGLFESLGFNLIDKYNDMVRLKKQLESR